MYSIVYRIWHSENVFKPSSREPINYLTKSFVFNWLTDACSGSGISDILCGLEWYFLKVPVLWVLFQWDGARTMKTNSITVVCRSSEFHQQGQKYSFSERRPGCGAAVWATTPFWRYCAPRYAFNIIIYFSI